MQIDHLRFESNLLDLLVCLEEEPIGGTLSPILKMLAKKGSHF